MRLRNSRVRVVLSISLCLLSGRELFAQAQAGTAITPYSFDGNLNNQPLAPAILQPAPPKAVNPSSPNIPPRPIGLPDPLWQKTVPVQGALGPGITPPQFTNPNPNFDTHQPGDGPPDANGAVGPNHYIAIVNFTFEIFDKNGNSLAGPTNPATLWSGAPTVIHAKINEVIPMFSMTTWRIAG